MTDEFFQFIKRDQRLSLPTILPPEKLFPTSLAPIQEDAFRTKSLNTKVDKIIFSDGNIPIGYCLWTKGAMFTYAIPGGLQPNDCAEIRGVLKGKKIYIGLVSNDFRETGDYPLKIMLQNGGIWKSESRYKNEMKDVDGILKNGFQEQMSFIINLVILDDKIQVSINLEKIGSFYKFPSGCELSDLTLDGDADFHSVEFKDAVDLPKIKEPILHITPNKNEKSLPQSFVRIDEKRMSQRDKHPKSIEAAFVQSNLKECIKKEKTLKLSYSSSSSSDDMNSNNKRNKDDIIKSTISKNLESKPHLEVDLTADANITLRAKDDLNIYDNLQGRKTINLGDIDVSHKLEIPNISSSLSMSKKDKIKKDRHSSAENIHKIDWSISNIFKRGSYTPKKHKQEESEGLYNKKESTFQKEYNLNVNDEKNKERNKKKDNHKHGLEIHLPKFIKKKKITLSEKDKQEIDINIELKKPHVDIDATIDKPDIEIDIEGKKKHGLDINLPDWKMPKFGGKGKKPKGELDIDVDINKPDIDVDVKVKKPHVDIDATIDKPDIEIDIKGRKKHGLDINLPDWKMPKFGGKGKKPKGELNIDVDINKPEIDVDVKVKKPHVDIDATIDKPDIEIDIEGKKKHGLDNKSAIFSENIAHTYIAPDFEVPSTNLMSSEETFSQISPLISKSSNFQDLSQSHEPLSKPDFEHRNSFFKGKFNFPFLKSHDSYNLDSPRDMSNEVSYGTEGLYSNSKERSPSPFNSSIKLYDLNNFQSSLAGGPSIEMTYNNVYLPNVLLSNSKCNKFSFTFDMPLFQEKPFSANLPRDLQIDKPISFIGQHCVEENKNQFSIIFESLDSNKFEIRLDNNLLRCKEFYSGIWQSEINKKILISPPDLDFRVVVLPKSSSKLLVLFNGEIMVEYYLKSTIDKLKKLKIEGLVQFQEVIFSE